MVRKRNINGSDCMYDHQSWKQHQKDQKQSKILNKIKKISKQYQKHIKNGPKTDQKRTENEPKNVKK